MTTPSEEPTGDYGYDLVHEESDLGRTDSRMASAHDHAGPPVDRTVELDGDYGYDEAHGL